MKKKPVKKSNGHAKEPESLKLNLGCGRLAQEGYKGCDIIAGPNVDFVFDLTKAPWPFRNDSVDGAICIHVFEHFDGAQRVKIMKEIWRVMRVGSYIDITVPYWSSMRSIQDPTHKWPPLCENSFLYFNTQWCRLNGIEHVGGIEPEYNFDYVYGFQTRPEFQNKNEETRTFAAMHYTNVSEDLNIRLTKLPLLSPVPRITRFRGENGLLVGEKSS